LNFRTGRDSHFNRTPRQIKVKYLLPRGVSDYDVCCGLRFELHRIHAFVSSTIAATCFSVPEIEGIQNDKVRVDFPCKVDILSGNVMQPTIGRSDTIVTIENWRHFLRQSDPQPIRENGRSDTDSPEKLTVSLGKDAVKLSPDFRILLRGHLLHRLDCVLRQLLGREDDLLRSGFECCHGYHPQ